MNTQRSFETIAIDEFLAERELALLIERGDAHQHGAMMRMRDGRLYVLREGVRILGNISHETDPYGFTGTADTLRALLKRGFVMHSERLALGRAIYEAEFGFLPQLISTGADQSGINPIL